VGDFSAKYTPIIIAALFHGVLLIYRVLVASLTTLALNMESGTSTRRRHGISRGMKRTERKKIESWIYNLGWQRGTT
jgi:hypothetical protein